MPYLLMIYFDDSVLQQFDLTTQIFGSFAIVIHLCAGKKFIQTGRKGDGSGFRWLAETINAHLLQLLQIDGPRLLEATKTLRYVPQIS